MTAKPAVSVRIDPDLYTVLGQEAINNNRSFTAQVEFLLRRGLAAKLRAYRAAAAAAAAAAAEPETEAGN